MLLVVVLVATETGGAVSVSAVFTSLAVLDVLAWCLHRFPVAGVRDILAMKAALVNIQAIMIIIIYFM
jgi:hypothetical protein